MQTRSLNANRLSALVGYIILSAMTIYLLALTLIEASALHSLGGILLIFISAGTVVSVYLEGKRIWQQKLQLFPFRILLFDFVILIAAAVLTFLLAHEFNLGTVVAACLIGILAHILTPAYESTAFTGAFVGMSSELMFLNINELFLAALIAAVVYLLAKNVFTGLGGKAGTVALVGTFLAGSNLQRGFIMQPLPDLSISLMIILFSVLSTPITFYLNINKNLGPIMSASLVGMFGGLILPALFPQYGELYAIIVITGAFIGMTCQTRCSSYRMLILAGLIMAIVTIYSTPLLGGAGGKLGTTAFISILAVTGYLQLSRTLRENA